MQLHELKVGQTVKGLCSGIRATGVITGFDDHPTEPYPLVRWGSLSRSYPTDPYNIWQIVEDVDNE
jgi:hypothetical protein